MIKPEDIIVAYFDNERDYNFVLYDFFLTKEKDSILAIKNWLEVKLVFIFF